MKHGYNIEEELLTIIIDNSHLVCLCCGRPVSTFSSSRMCDICQEELMDQIREHLNRKNRHQ